MYFHKKNQIYLYFLILFIFNSIMYTTDKLYIVLTAYKGSDVKCTYTFCEKYKKKKVIFITV